MTTTFELKVALLGYVSVGKSTVLNALLKDKFSEVSMRRTTAGVNFFRIHTSNGSTPTKATAENRTTHSAMVTPEQTMAVIMKENKKLRDAISLFPDDEGAVRESTFDVAVDEPIIRSMRTDTRLVLVDLPGINEANSNDKYRNYLNTILWHTLDCVVVVMDVNQGVNTAEQVELLELVKKNCTSKKDIPIIVVCNKVDDPDNAEVAQLVHEVHFEVERIFSSNEAASPTKKARRSSNSSKKQKNAPIFVPISAETAFLYRTVSCLSFEKFKQLDKAIVDRIGSEEIGKSKWRKMSQDEKYAAAYEAVKDETAYDGSIATSNFQSFLDALNNFLGGNDVQLQLIAKQQAVSLSRLSFDSNLSLEIRKIYDTNVLLGKTNTPCGKYFWEVYERYSKESIEFFKSDMDQCSF